MTARALAAPSAWPAAVWDSPVLRALDARARGDIEAAGALVKLERGQALFRAGEPADSFFVVCEGAIDVRAVRRGERDASVIRRVVAGDALGEEATLHAGASRTMDALCAERACVASVPVAVFRRATGRAGGGELAARAERTLRRAATRDLFRAASFTRELPEGDVDLLLDAARHVSLVRGDHVFRQGDVADEVFLVADGMVQLQTEDDRRLQVRAYVARGDLLGEEAARGERRAWSAVASGASWIVALARPVFEDIASRHPETLARVRRVAVEQRAAQEAVAVGATQHVLKDAYRMTIARSLLVIDQDSCVRCGHCAWSCAESHEDGVSRLVRRGDKGVTAFGGASSGEESARASLLVPNTCQHCEHPACMIDCPTGAIGRDPRGDVFIRESLCIGCGACAKACPWDNVQIAPRAKSSRKRLPLVANAPALSELVAVKCDLCRDVATGPACVSACPTDALARVKPSDALPELGAVFAPTKKAPSVVAAKRLAWPWMVGAGLLGIAVARLPWSRLASGAVAGAIVVLLFAYVVVKRGLPRLARARRPSARARTRMHDERTPRSMTRIAFIAHLAFGAVSLGAVMGHGGARVTPNVGGALALAFWAAALTGVCAAIAYAVVPRLLTRLERGGALPEDLADHHRSFDERVFAALSGKSDGQKAIWARILRPYARAPWGSFLLALRGASLGAEEARLRRRVDRILAGRNADGASIDALVRLAVEGRALPAQRMLGASLRVWLPLHVMTTAVAMVLLVVHVVFALRGAR